MNGHACLGRFYPCPEADVSYLFPLPEGELSLACVRSADAKAVGRIAKALKEAVEKAQVFLRAIGRACFGGERKEEEEEKGRERKPGRLGEEGMEGR